MTARPVVLPWSCHRSGDCCAQTSQIVMTPEEMKLLAVRRPELKFYVHPDTRFVYLKGKPCPLLAYDEGGKALCTEYEHRPYGCRRFGCFRPDPKTEPYQNERVDLERGRVGCANLSDRLANRAVRRAYALLQRKAQRWGLKHGWSEAMTGRQVGSDVILYSLTRTPSAPPAAPGGPDQHSPTGKTPPPGPGTELARTGCE